ncbi:hypothetical protein PCANC_18570 [Puccinia coronata f. sp. avenae]|uniref:Riboflavin kinase n=1 Tax=Puccinia coronata f. sp. avenae TaxID=200324 RepID=A0A2N5STC6_9BASI|nr:hypothetical protein PCANC_18570 [Puccinia coronata f. sp. avenae]
MSSLASASRTQPSPASQHVPPPQQRPSDHDASPRPTIIGPESAPEPPFPVRLCGIVEHGFKRGSRELGCPTANLPASLTANPALDRNGVYFGWAAVWLSMPSPQPPVIKPMVMSVGYNPVYGNTSRTIEVHVIHTFDQDFYGDLVKVIVTGFIRPEYNYTSKEALIQDIDIDKTAALHSLQRPAYQAFAQDKYLLTNLPGPPRLSKPTAPAAGSMGLACRDRELQPPEAWASLAETDRSGGWEHQSHLLRPTASAAGTIGLSFRD